MTIRLHGAASAVGRDTQALPGQLPSLESQSARLGLVGGGLSRESIRRAVGCSEEEIGK